MIFPEALAGGVEIRDAAGNPTNPPNVNNAYVPPAAYVTTCTLTALPSDCTARIEPKQINAIVSELLAFAECLDPDGPWECEATNNLCTSFQTWLTAFNTYNDERFVNVTGDTMTGPLHLAADPIDPTEAATKAYIDAAIAAAAGLDASMFVNVTGDTMTGPLQLPIAAPVAQTEAANKEYVDASIGFSEGSADAKFVKKAGDTMSGDLTIAKTSWARITLDSLDNNGGIYIGKRNGIIRWAMYMPSASPESGANAGSDFVLEAYSDVGANIGIVLSGKRSTGLMSVKANPTDPLGIATKQYVDTAVAAAVSPAFPAGTTMLFWQAAAPVGWTKLTTQNDKALRVVSGATGGGSGGTNAFSTVMAQTVVGNQTPDNNTMFFHNHIGPSAAYQFAYYIAGGGGNPPPGGSGFSSGPNTGYAGVGNPHNHSITMAIQYIDLILARKD